MRGAISLLKVLPGRENEKIIKPMRGSSASIQAHPDSYFTMEDAGKGACAERGSQLRKKDGRYEAEINQLRETAQ